MKTMKSLKKAISLLLCAIMLLSIIPLSNIEAEAATYTYPKISALKVPRIQQPGGDTTGMCHFNSIASIIAYRLGSYSYDGYSRTYSYGTDYAYSSDPIWQKMSDVNNGSMDPTYSFSKYPVKIESKKVSGNNAETYKLIYNQLKLGNPVVVYGPYHASVVIGYTASTNSLDASKFSVMEITKDGNWWSNSKSYFDSYANAPQTDRANNGPMPCYVTLSSWLSYCNVKISRISYCEGTPKNTLSVYYNANGGSISSDTYYLSSGNVYKTSDKSKLVHKWYYNDKQTNGLYDDTTFGLKRDGYTFVGWSTTSSGEFWFDKKDNTILPTDINPNVKNGDCSTTLYAVWEKDAEYFNSIWVDEISTNDAEISASYITADYESISLSIGTSKNNMDSIVERAMEFGNELTFKISEYSSKLKPSTTYYYSFEAVIDGVSYHSETGSFKTLDANGYFASVYCDNITGSNAVIHAEIPQTTVDEYGFYITPYGEETKRYTGYTSGTMTEISFELSPYIDFSLDPNRIYSYSFFIVIDEKEYVSDIYEFVTAPPDNYFIYTEAKDVTSDNAILYTDIHDTAVDSYGFYFGYDQDNLTQIYIREEQESSSYYLTSISCSVSSCYGQLEPMVVYIYQFFVVIDGVEYRSYLDWFQTDTTECLISYFSIDGTGIPESHYVGYGETFTVSRNIPVRDGYTFMWWETEDGITFMPGDMTSVIGDVVFYAVWEPADYVVSFFVNGEKFAPDITFTPGEAVTIPSDYQIEDFDANFEGWCETADASSTIYYPGDTFYPEGDTSLYAIYKYYHITEGKLLYLDFCEYRINDMVKFVPDVSGEYVIKTVYADSRTDTYGALLSEEGIFLDENDNYDQENGNYNFKFTHNLVANETYYIDVINLDGYDDAGTYLFVSRVHNLFFDANGGTGAPLAHDGDATYYIPDIIPVREGYTFLGWSEYKNATAPQEFMNDMINIKEDTTLYAVWEKNDEPTTNPDEPTTNPDEPTPGPEPDNDLHIEIKNPSTTKIKYKNGIILHSEITGELPEGARIVWETSNGNFKIERSDNSSCRIMSSANGLTDITIKIVAADGEILAEDYVTMTSNAGFFQKIIAFFKSLFGILPEVLPQVFKKAF